MKNPNKVRSLIGAFCGQNAINFHRDDGKGYRYLADKVIELNAINPQIASRLLTPLTRWQRFHEVNQEKMLTELQRIASQENLSSDVFEVVKKSLDAK